jgi:hypothetical protein
MGTLVAKNGEERVEILFSRSIYGHDKKHMSKVQNPVNKYPCVQSVSVESDPCCFWYSDADKGHFGISKVILTRLGEGAMVDMSGQYGLCDDCFGIVDERCSLERIYSAVKSKKFISLMRAANPSGLAGGVYSHKIIGLFRKDFWVDFQ